MNPLLSAVLRAVLLCAGALVTPLPRRLELALGRALGRFLHAFDFKRKKIVRENIARCLPELGERERRRLIKENYEHYGVLTFELLHIFSPIPGHFHRYTIKNSTVDGLEIFQRLNAQGKGTIAFTGHFANWEMMSICGILGVNVMVTGRKVKPEWLNDRVVAARLANNTRTASGSRILPELLRWIKAGNTSVFILDQYAAPPAGVPVKFFGVEVHTQSVVGLVAQRTGAPIFTVFQRRDARGVIHAVFKEVKLTPEQQADPVKATQAFALEIEEWIREHPSQWLWAHRRFKNVSWPRGVA